MTCVGGELYLKIHAYVGICMCCVGARVLQAKVGEALDSRVVRGASSGWRYPKVGLQWAAVTCVCVSAGTL